MTSVPVVTETLPAFPKPRVSDEIAPSPMIFVRPRVTVVTFAVIDADARNSRKVGPVAAIDEQRSRCHGNFAGISQTVSVGSDFTSVDNSKGVFDVHSHV